MMDQVAWPKAVIHAASYLGLAQLFGCRRNVFLMRTTGPAVSDFAVQEEHELWLDWLESLVRLESNLAFISAQTVLPVLH